MDSGMKLYLLQTYNNSNCLQLSGYCAKTLSDVFICPFIYYKMIHKSILKKNNQVSQAYYCAAFFFPDENLWEDL